jgi:hypothetical protein
MLTHTTLVIAIVLAALGPVIMDVALLARRVMVPCRCRAGHLPERRN